ncbi:prostatic acid phosphatase [Drosophila madeirensis]|uniref:Prostatic acid phosphatase n=1 Tax=Drosophila madeirensis TaxID=30013 RepID=A0AAU9FN72_DROMD|nr:prostatic acid phosphatase [Drosophila subobscura]XP_034657104.1 prostatic acid phosphatase [Drosophila subobscura]
MIFGRWTRKQILTMFGLGGAVVGAIIVIAVLNSNVSSEELSRHEAATAKCFKTRPNTTQSTLELVHIVFRHGIRTPVDTYPNDPYLRDGFKPTGWGHVTNSGKRELYEMGRWLNRRYSEFMGPYYRPDRLHAQATASPRAMMSLQTTLASMFEPKGTPMEWNKKLNWQPIPIVSEPLDQDSLLLVRTPCPRYFEAWEEVFKRPEVIAETKPYEQMFRELTNLTGMPVRNAEDVNSLYITLLAEKEFGYELPSWTKDYFPDRMQFLAEQSYIYNAYTPEMQKIKGGPFLKRMYKEMSEKRDGSLRPKDRGMYIYAGHDWTVGNILSALGVWKRQMPRFAVMAIFETHRDKQTGEYYVEIFLRNDEHGCLEQLQLRDCDRQCPLSRLIELSSEVLPNEPMEQRCRPHSPDFVEPPPRLIDQNAGR